MATGPNQTNAQAWAQYKEFYKLALVTARLEGKTITGAPR